MQNYNFDLKWSAVEGICSCARSMQNLLRHDWEDVHERKVAQIQLFFGRFLTAILKKEQIQLQIQFMLPSQTKSCSVIFSIPKKFSITKRAFFISAIIMNTRRGLLVEQQNGKIYEPWRKRIGFRFDYYHLIPKKNGISSDWIPWPVS